MATVGAFVAVAVVRVVPVAMELRAEQAALMPSLFMLMEFWRSFLAAAEAATAAPPPKMVPTATTPMATACLCD